MTWGALIGLGGPGVIALHSEGRTGRCRISVVARLATGHIFLPAMSAVSHGTETPSKHPVSYHGASNMSFKMPSDKDLKCFEIRRAMVIHEDGQVNQRINFLLVAQTFMLVAAVTVLVATIPPSDKLALSSLLSAAATLMIIWTNRSIAAAGAEMEEVRRESGQYQDVFHIEEDRVRVCLQAGEGPFEGGMTLARNVPALLLALWVGVAVCGAHIAFPGFGLPGAVAVTVVVAFVCGFGFRWSKKIGRYRHKSGAKVRHSLPQGDRSTTGVMNVNPDRVSGTVRIGVEDRPQQAIVERSAGSPVPHESKGGRSTSGGA
jgi:hypothetical protein